MCRIDVKLIFFVLLTAQPLAARAAELERFRIPGASLEVVSMNDRGTILGNTKVDGRRCFFLRSPAGKTKRVCRAGSDLRAIAMNNRGVVIGVIAHGELESPFVYDQGVLSELPLPQGARGGTPLALNDEGEIVGWVQTNCVPDSEYDGRFFCDETAARFSLQGATLLGGCPAGYTCGDSRAEAINNRGEMEIMRYAFPVQADEDFDEEFYDSYIYVFRNRDGSERPLADVVFDTVSGICDDGTLLAGGSLVNGHSGASLASVFSPADRVDWTYSFDIARCAGRNTSLVFVNNSSAFYGSAGGGLLPLACLFPRFSNERVRYLGARTYHITANARGWIAGSLYEPGRPGRKTGFLLKGGTRGPSYCPILDLKVLGACEPYFSQGHGAVIDDFKGSTGQSAWQPLTYKLPAGRRHLDEGAQCTVAVRALDLASRRPLSGIEVVFGRTSDTIRNFPTQIAARGATGAHGEPALLSFSFTPNDTRAFAVAAVGDRRYHRAYLPINMARF